MTASELTAVRASLEKWAGCWAEPWDYTTSHDWLRIKLQRKGEDFSCAILALAGCEPVSFVGSWEGFNPSITEYSGPHGIRYRVTDGDRLEVECVGVSVSRTLKSYADIPTMHDHLFGEAAI